jgi:hypothetical protein
MTVSDLEIELGPIERLLWSRISEMCVNIKGRK